MTIRCCIRCGSSDLGGSTFLDATGMGSVAGISRCNSCGHEGIAVEFDTEKAAAKFRDSLK